MKRTCGTCEFGAFELTRHKTPRPRPMSIGHCGWNLGDKLDSLVPLSVELRMERLPIFPEWADCPYWAAKGGAK